MTAREHTHEGGRGAVALTVTEQEARADEVGKVGRGGS